MSLSEVDGAAWADRRAGDRSWWNALITEARKRADRPELVLVLERLAYERLGDPVPLARALAEAESEPDSVLRVWLASAAAALDTVRTLNPRATEEVRVVRRLRNEIHQLTPCLPHVRSASVADELRAWIALRPSLLS
ncbi:hypothetical protein Lesp02_50760 [Lentzea sp. NBRC 105346]|uniref:hypothetical protein n=1 Tax=Lentzea sp. NBRC 105346 TaxID=3032205 RepID=UPI0024A46817|nr:hypothetical protein [Lentzea sp. NBRC 105346]GLZ32888.1 hypothetical protein Lesp02_50760 [Lentzea sp. NBRC 105346]